MGMAEFLEKRFLGKEMCISVANGETETLIYDQHWVNNREFFEGIIKEIIEGIIVLSIAGGGEIYINSSEISYVWERRKVDPHKVMRTSLTKKLNKIGKNL